MSGGSFDYAYSKLGELDSWVETLELMAKKCADWATSDRAKEKYEPDGKRVPATMEDRARVMVRAMLLEKAAARLRRAVDEVRDLSDVMHDVEWIASGDTDVYAIMKPLKVED